MAPKTKKNVDFIPNATYSAPPATEKDMVGAAIDLILATVTSGEDGMPLRPGATVAIQGTHGTGKTSAAKAAASSRDLGVVYLSAPVLDITNMYCSFPERVQAEDRTRVKTILHNLFTQDKPYLIVLDDFRRVQPSAQGAMFELMNEGTLSGLPLNGLVGVLLIDNPAGDGYLGVGGGDPAFETRFHTIEVDANDTPWRSALAAKYSEVNLKGLFDTWSGWDPRVRRTVNPRVLDHLIGVTLAGLPTEVGMPILPSGRQKIIDGGEHDVTERVLRSVAENLGVPFREKVDNLLGKCIKVALANGWNMHIVGPHAVGKTAVIRAVLDDENIEQAYLSMAHQTPADLLVTVPTSSDGVEVIPNEKLVAQPGQRKVIVADEAFRAGANIKGQMLEMFQERSLGGVPLGVDAVFALNNPAKWGEFTYPVGKADEALCSRFELNLFVDADDTPWKDYLVERYDAANVHPFLEWRAHSLNEIERAIVAPRVMEKLIQVHLYNCHAKAGAELPLETALPMGADGKRVPIRLHDLNKRLAGAKVLGFSRIVEESEAVLEQLYATSDDENIESARLALQIEVTRALQNAELFELNAHIDLCVELLRASRSAERIAVFRSAKSAADSTERQNFWAGVAKKLRATEATS